MEQQNQKCADQRNLIASGALMVFMKRSDGKLQAVWGEGRDRIYVTPASVKFALHIKPGTGYEVDIYQVRTRNGVLTVAEPTTAMKTALGMPPGDVILETCLQPKAHGQGVFAIEPMTGKRIYPERGVRVWVNRFDTYMAKEIGAHLIVYPIEEPQEHRRDPNCPDQPYTCKVPPQQRSRYNRGRDNRRPRQQRNQQRNQPPRREPAKRQAPKQQPEQKQQPSGDGTLQGGLQKFIKNDCAE